MSQQVLSTLSSAAAATVALPAPAGLAADLVLHPQVQAIAASVGLLQVQLALRMAALERQSPGPADVRGQAVRAGIPADQAHRLRLVGLFTTDHDDLRAALLTGTATLEQADILRLGARRLRRPDLREQLVDLVLPHLPPLDAAATRRVVAWAVDLLQPADPDTAEADDQAARRLSWSRIAGGGVVFEGYLPAGQAGAFTAAINALVDTLRVREDGLTTAQRRADALSALLDTAAAGLPTGGGLPATTTLTVSLDEAIRIAMRDPASHGRTGQRRPHGGSRADGQPAGDAAVRFGLCCGQIVPVLHDTPPPGSPLAAIANTRIRPLAVGRGLRLASTAQRTALHARDGGCAIPGCDIPDRYTEPHHVTGWALDGPTDLDNLVALCGPHHRMTENGRFRFIPRTPETPKPDGALEHPRWWILPPHIIT